MTNQKFLQQVIAHLEEIPDERWCEGKVHEGEARCGWGHVYAWMYGDAERTASFQRLPLTTVISANDGLLRGYHQATPKERSLAFLKSLLAKENE